MLPQTILFTLFNSLLALASNQPAVAITNNPRDVVLRADFPTGNSQTVVGIVQFYSLNGTTKVHVDITGLPKNSGVFSYHIHDKPLGPDSSCEQTGGHFNPFKSQGDCDTLADDALCEVGDLSGKHGLINTTCFETFFYDPYLSLDPNHPQYIGNKALNIHLVDKNNERLACANIKPSREPEDLLMLNTETEREEVKKYEELSGVKIENYDYEETYAQDYDFGISVTPVEVEDVLQSLEAREYEEIYEETVIEETEYDEEEPAHEEESLDLDSDLEELVEDDTAEESEFEDENKQSGLIGNHTLNATNLTIDSGDEEEENASNRLHSRTILGCIAAASVALLI